MKNRISRVALVPAVVATAISLSACGYSPDKDTPGFKPSEVTTYADAVKHLAPKYGANADAVMRLGKQYPSDLNRADGANWEYVVTDGRTAELSDPWLKQIFGGDTQGSCISISSQGVYWYSQMSTGNTDAWGGEQTTCRNLITTQASVNPTILKLSDDGTRWTATQN